MGGVGVRAGGAVAAAWAVALLLAACGGDGGEAAAPATTTDDHCVGPHPIHRPTTALPPWPPATATDPARDAANSRRPATYPRRGRRSPARTSASSTPPTCRRRSTRATSRGGSTRARWPRCSPANRFGWTDVEIALDDPHTVQVTDTASQHLVSLQMRQPAREGETGIWVVDSGVWLG